MHEMDIEWFCGMAMNGRESEGWEGVDRVQIGAKGLSYTDESGNRPLVTTLIEKKACVSLFSLSERDIL